MLSKKRIVLVMVSIQNNVTVTKTDEQNHVRCRKMEGTGEHLIQSRTNSGREVCLELFLHLWKRDVEK